MYEHKDLYTIDFTDVQYYIEMHLVIREALNFPEYYGCNWDALWDCLTDMVGDDPIHIEIVGLDVIERRFDDAAKTMLEIFKEFKHCYDDMYVNDICIEIVNGATRVTLM